MTTGLVIAVAAVLATVGVIALRSARDGRFRASSRSDAATAVTGPTAPTAWEQVGAAVPGAAPGERATLVQFSSAFCAPCRATRTLLTDVAAREPGLVHLEIDAEEHLDLVRSLGVLRTPTTLVLDAAGREVVRASGAPRREQVTAALAGVDAEVPR